MKIFLIMLTTLSLTLAFDFGSIVDKGSEILNSSQKDQKSKNGSQTESNALKEALNIGTNYAIETLSGDGFLNHSSLKIPLPESLQSVGKVASKLGGQKYVDDFVSSMNKAAGNAVGKTASIFADTISNMSFDDTVRILKGEDNAATEYFKKNTSDSLNKAILPIVKDSMAKSDVTKYYQSLKDYTKGGDGILSQANNVASSFGVGIGDENLEDYVTKAAINGLFTLISEQEKQIRANPLSYSSKLIQQVFGK